MLPDSPEGLAGAGVPGSHTRHCPTPRRACGHPERRRALWGAGPGRLPPLVSRARPGKVGSVPDQLSCRRVPEENGPNAARGEPAAVPRHSESLGRPLIAAGRQQLLPGCQRPAADQAEPTGRQSVAIRRHCAMGQPPPCAAARRQGFKSRNLEKSASHSPELPTRPRLRSPVRNDPSGR